MRQGPNTILKETRDKGRYGKPTTTFMPKQY